MALVNLATILKGAEEGKYAVPAFDVLEKVSTEAIINAAEDANRPVILMVPETGLPLVDMESFFEYLVGIAKRAKVPVALQLDHGQTYDVLVKAIHYGFSSIMIDASHLSYDENVRQTRKIVEVAHAAGVSVEAEIGHVGGGEGNMDGSDVDKSMFTKPEDAERFVKETGVDALAIAFGTVHGIYKGTPKLDIELLNEIRDRVSVPLVMHGGSGVSNEEFVKAIENGIRKINLFTEISMAAVAKSVEHAQSKDNKLHFAEMLMVGGKTVEGIASGYLKLFSLQK